MQYLILLNNYLIFLWKPWRILRILWIEHSKEHLFEIETFCKIINGFTVTTDHFTAAKKIQYFNHSDPKLLKGSVYNNFSKDN